MIADRCWAGKTGLRDDSMIYFDNACTSFPKPPAVLEAIQDYSLHIGSTPGRSGHRLALEAARLIFDARENLSQLFNISRSERLVFTSNATEALNLAIMGLLTEGGHVIAPSMEHNSVMRPLNYLLRQGLIELSIIRCSEAGHIDLDRPEGIDQEKHPAHCRQPRLQRRGNHRSPAGDREIIRGDPVSG